jgi:roadblock/LC7 domain-containing protein
LQVFVAGLQNDIGRLSDVSPVEEVKLTHSVYSDDPIFAVFRFVDLTFIVQVVLSLFAILFTYDAINGEREGGTLALSFSNPLPKATYLTGKVFGAWVGLVLPLMIPALLCILLVLLLQVPFDGGHWIRIGVFGVIALLYFTFFAMLGLLISALTRRSSVSFLLSLVAWIALVLIIPRAGVMAAGQIVHVPSVAEMDGRIAAYAKEQWARHMNDMQARWQQRNAIMAPMSADERTAYQQQHEWEWFQQEDSSRSEVQKDIEQQTGRFMEDLRNRKETQIRLGLGLSRFSPASAFQLAAMRLAGTDVDLKTRYEDAMQAYRREFNAYRQKRERESGGGGIRISMDNVRGFSFSAPRDAGSLNLSDMPVFTPPTQSLLEYIAPSFIDIGLLLVLGSAAFAGAFAAFVRYDVR